MVHTRNLNDATRTQHARSVTCKCGVVRATCWRCVGVVGDVVAAPGGAGVGLSRPCPGPAAERSGALPEPDRGQKGAPATCPGRPASPATPSGALLGLPGGLSEAPPEAPQGSPAAPEARTDPAASTSKEEGAPTSSPDNLGPGPVWYRPAPGLPDP